MFADSSLPDVWYALFAVILWIYLVTDGFDLGVGVLTLLDRDEARRAAMMESVEPVWHANQTWLVILGGVLFGAFPHAYGAVLPALYLPAGLMLLFLILRGVGLECHGEAENKRLFSNLFGLGSLGVILTQGLMLGTAVMGLPLVDGRYQGGLFAWIAPFPLAAAFALCAACVMLGGGWLLFKTTGEIRRRALRDSRLAGGAAAVFLCAAVVLRIDLFGSGADFATSFMPVALALVMHARSLRREAPAMAFAWAAGLVLFSLIAFASALSPFLVPPSLTVAQAAASPGSLRIMLWVIGPLMPVIIGYNIYQYRVFARPER